MVLVSVDVVVVIAQVIVYVSPTVPEEIFTNVVVVVVLDETCVNPVGTVQLADATVSPVGNHSDQSMV